jgi:hypothetical protein
MEALIGRYDADLIRLTHLSGPDLCRIDQSLIRFFKQFPEKKHPEDFSFLDVDFYYKSELAKGRTLSFLNRDLKHLRAFFNYLIDYLDYPLMSNPASLREPSFWREQRQLLEAASVGPVAGTKPSVQGNTPYIDPGSPAQPTEGSCQ